MFLHDIYILQDTDDGDVADDENPIPQIPPRGRRWKRPRERLETVNSFHVGLFTLPHILTHLVSRLENHSGPFSRSHGSTIILGAFQH